MGIYRRLKLERERAWDTGAITTLLLASLLLVLLLVACGGGPAGDGDAAAGRAGADTKEAPDTNAAARDDLADEAPAAEPRVLLTYDRTNDEADTGADAVLVDLSTGSETLLATNAEAASVSPLGDQAAFAQEEEGEYFDTDTLFVASIDGTNPQALVEASHIVTTGWSPSGDLYYEATNSEDEDARLYRVSGVDSETEIEQWRGDFSGIFSPDGTHTVTSDLYVRPLDRNIAPTRLPTPPSPEDETFSAAGWTAEGVVALRSCLYYEDSCSTPSKLVVLDPASGRVLRELAELPPRALRASVAGEWVAYENDDEEVFAGRLGQTPRKVGTGENPRLWQVPGAIGG